MDTALHTSPRPLWLRMVRSAGRMVLTLAIIGAATGAGRVGYQNLAAQATAAEAPPPAPRSTVATAPLILQTTVSLPRRFTGQFEAPQEVQLGFEDAGTVQAITVREGDRVAAGDVLARLDTRLLHAETTRLAASRAATEARAELARRTHERQAALLRSGHVTQQRLDETSLHVAQLEAALDEIDAALTALDIRLSKAAIRAPFAGRIGARLLDTGAVAGPGAPVLRLLEDGPARFRVALAPALADRLAPGTGVEIELPQGRVPARMSDLAPALDPLTRSRVAVFDLLPGTLSPPARATGDVIVMDTQPATGAWVPLSALRQGPRGTWTLLGLRPSGGATGVITQLAVEILHLAEDRAFVRGGFTPGLHYLPGGTHRVVPGETVRVAEAG